MRFKGRMKLEHGLHQIDIVPLINTIFLLLVFFMLTSNFVLQPGIRVDLPKAVTSEVVKYENIEIVLDKENKIYLNDKLITIADLKLLFHQLSGRSQTVLVKADKRASLGVIVEIWDLARSQGVSRINLATNQE
ncbi:MAG: biopolymer transporter ExbD [Candidatus Omnitrophica bacterium]|nr:biopolymer transporter ExbD [Candidatus Omnitrophota bacterium]